MRLFDLLAALCGLIILFPVLLILALWIKVTSPGSVIFKQLRVGKDGCPFYLYKFRSMVTNAEQLGSSVTIDYDPRITCVGRILRRTKLDELPQLWNVIKGDMSLVGPRPDVPEIVDTYSPQMRQILAVRPGITSFASLHIINEEEILSQYADPDQAYLDIIVPLKIKLGMLHVEYNSFWFDIKILLQTIWALSLGRFIFRLDKPPEVIALQKITINQEDRS